MLSWQLPNQRQSLSSSIPQRRVQFTLSPPNSLSHSFHKYASLLLALLPTDTEPVRTWSLCGYLLQFDKQPQQRKNRSPSKENSKQGFPLGENRVSEDKMAARYLNAGGELRPAHLQVSKPPKSCRTCVLFAEL